MNKVCNFCNEEIDNWHIGGHALDYHIECFENVNVLERIKADIDKRIKKLNEGKQ